MVTPGLRKLEILQGMKDYLEDQGIEKIKDLVGAVR